MVCCRGYCCQHVVLHVCVLCMYCCRGYCCSQFGQCTRDPKGCDGTCQCRFSGEGSGCKGSFPFPLPRQLPVASKGGLCGAYVATCPSSQCCSMFGFCVNGEHGCAVLFMYRVFSFCYKCEPSNSDSIADKGKVCVVVWQRSPWGGGGTGWLASVTTCEQPSEPGFRGPEARPHVGAGAAATSQMRGANNPEALGRFRRQCPAHKRKAHRGESTVGVSCQVPRTCTGLCGWPSS